MNYTSKGMIQKVLFILKKCCHFLSKCDIIQKNVEEVLLVIQVKKISVRYFPSDTREKQGTRSDITPLLNEGYSISYQNNGYWVLTKKPKIMVTLNCEENGVYTFNMTNDILSYYGRTRISEKLSKDFEREFRNGDIKIFTDGQTFYFKR